MTRNKSAYLKAAFKAILCLAAISSFAVSVQAQSSSFIARTYQLLGNTHAAADFNGDGRLDLAGSGLNAASVMLNNGDGTFRPKIDYPVPGQTQDIAAGDFNGDGKMDLAVSINTQQISLSLLIGNGDGTFNAPVNFANTSGADSPSIVAADLNNDGKLDVVIMHSIGCFTAPCIAAQTISVMLGNGDGTFQPTRELAAGQNMHRMTTEDFNRDGTVDLAIGGENTQLYILLGVGNGTFIREPAITVIPGGDLFSACNDVDVADFDRDGVQDVVVALGNGRGNAILLGNGDGTFRQTFRITDNALNAPFNLAVADYNGDGFQDIARGMGNGDSGLVEIANGNGNGTFQPPVRYLVPPPFSSVGAIFITSSDLNGDGRPDLALEVGGASTALDVLINSTGAIPPPTPVTVSNLTLNPSSVTGGSSSTGSVTLSATVQTATVVQLSSSSQAASVPASITVPAGSSSSSFTVNTGRVTVATTATIRATLNGVSRSANLSISLVPPPPPQGDTVAISRAEYDSQKRTLRLEASSTRATATLQAFVTSSGQFIGTLTNNGGGRFAGQFTLPTNPQSVTVRSNLGGQATRIVTVK